ncbi:hypothetical protein [Saccharicrinis fermentans]|uniref:Uncharacterized protein n=1 Tax=Saccharicrinis fermentans DSM 9555 = JCM 21142 TaxID=869213 RepID=W7YDX3_9BACT|nr:hypothetical protein [Saccharicrinis fermentans]GAF05663.1 hypothetical protein JCM21142_104408 [Saccharicrinis fermentans DSM 9555 = JCM 21142]
MSRIGKTVVFITSILMGLVLVRFAISKLAGWEISVNAFIEMAQPLGIDPTFFRVSTGFLISAVLLAYFSNAIYTLFQHKVFFIRKLNYYRFSLFANSFGLLTMVGALLAEFFLRVQPKWPLVYIAVGIIVFSMINILIIIRKENQQVLPTH